MKWRRGWRVFLHSFQLHFISSSVFRGERNKWERGKIEEDLLIVVGGVCCFEWTNHYYVFLHSSLICHLFCIRLLLPAVADTLLTRDVFGSCRLLSPGPFSPWFTGGPWATILWLVCMHNPSWGPCGMQWLQARTWLLSEGTLRCWHQLWHSWRNMGLSEAHMHVHRAAAIRMHAHHFATLCDMRHFTEGLRM